jgi:quercetin dioxygenase-like cupin family protein
MSDRDDLDVDRIVRSAPATFQQRVVDLAPGAAVGGSAARWRDAIVFVTAGEVEVECASGARGRFRHGDVVCLSLLPLRAIRNPGSAGARLVAISRRR